MQASVTAVPLAGNAFDLIVSFDVLYHQAVGSDDRALTEFWRILKPGGLLLVRLPALESLRGEHDVVVHTRHRYERTELGAKLQTARFQLLRLTYANGLLLPLIYLRRQLQTSAQSTHVESDVSLPSPLINRLLESILTLERLWLTRFNLPIGVSLFALAAKPN